MKHFGILNSTRNWKREFSVHSGNYCQLFRIKINSLQSTTKHKNFTSAPASSSSGKIKVADMIFRAKHKATVCKEVTKRIFPANIECSTQASA
jgi:hypothetical protein